jgi:O-antigen ligase
MEGISELRPKNIFVIEKSGSHTALKALLALLLFAICLGGDIFFDIFFIKNFIIFYIYFTLICFSFFALLIKNNRIRLSYVVIPLAVYIGINFLSLFWTVRLKDAEISIVLLFTGFLTFIIFSNVIEAEEDIYFFSKFIVAAISLTALWAIGQGVFGYKFFGNDSFAATGTIYNPNAFSGLLGMVYPIAILISVKEKKILWLLPIFFIPLANFFTISRVGIFTNLLISAVSLVFLFKRGHRSLGIKILLVIVLAVLTYFVLFSLRSQIYTGISSEITLRRDPTPSAVINRTEIWKGTLPIVSQHLFWGVGLRSFQDLFKHLNNPYVVWPRPHAHNLFLQITSEVGIVGLLFFILFIFGVFFTCIKNCRNSENLQFKTSSFFLLLAISGFLFSNLTEYNWEHPLFQVSFYFLASIIFVMERYENPERKEISLLGTRPFKFVFSGMLVVFWIFYAGNPWIASYYLSEAKKLELKNAEEAIHYLCNASLLDSSNPEPYSVLSHIYRNAWLNTKRELFFEKALQAQKMVIHSFPMEADPYLDLARLCEEAKRLNLAESYYEKAMKTNPNMPEYKHQLALFSARNNKTDRAIALWEDLKLFLERYEPKGIFLMTVYMNLCGGYKKIQNLERLKKHLNLVVTFSEEVISKEPASSPLREIFISYKKKAANELASLVKRKNP